MTRGLKISEGAYLAVSPNGFIVEGYKNGPKLYFNKNVARKYAGFGGRVFHIYESADGGINISQVFE